MASSSASLQWEDVLFDPVADLTTRTEALCFCDVDNTGTKQLVGAFHKFEGKKTSATLQVHTPYSFLRQIALNDLASGVVPLWVSDTQDLPAVGVAVGESLYVFKALRPYYKFTLPATPLEEKELNIWMQAREDDADPVSIASLLTELAREQELSPRSVTYLNLAEEKRAEFLQSVADSPIEQRSTITAVSALPKVTGETTKLTCVVLGTEDGKIYVLHPSNFSVLAQYSCGGPVISVFCSGAFDSEFRIVAATRNSTLATIKSGSSTVTHLSVEAPVLSVARIQKTIVCACADGCMRGYSTKGKLAWTEVMPASITAMLPIAYRPKQFRGCFVALSNGEVRLYSEHTLISKMVFDVPMDALAFDETKPGNFFLILISRDGHYISKRLLRGSTFQPEKQDAADEQARPISIPKKTQVYLDQTQRERENSAKMYRAFLRDLFGVKLTAARSYARVVSANVGAIARVRNVSLHITASVHGMGPTFKLAVDIQNLSRSTLPPLVLEFSFDKQVYNMKEAVVKTTNIPARSTTTITALIRCISPEEQRAAPVTCNVFHAERTERVAAAHIDMPVAEPLLQVR